MSGKIITLKSEDRARNSFGVLEQTLVGEGQGSKERGVEEVAGQ